MNLSAAEARERFARSPVAVLGTISPGADGPEALPGRPHLVPVTFLLLGERIFVAVDDKPKRSRDLKRLSNIAANARVCLLAQHYEADWTRLWWARADGTARVLDRDEVADGVLDGLAQRYPRYWEHPPAGPFIEISVTAWSAWAAGG